MSSYNGPNNPFSEPNPTIKEFREHFEVCAKEISCTGINLNSHNIPSSVTVECINDDATYSIVGMDMDGLAGCGCPASISIQIEKDKCWNYDKLTKDMAKYEEENGENQPWVNIVKIVVSSEFEKDQLLKASRYIKQLRDQDVDFMAINTLANLYSNPELIEVVENENT